MSDATETTGSPKTEDDTSAEQTDVVGAAHDATAADAASSSAASSSAESSHATAAQDDSADAATSRPSRTELLEEEGDIAADYLEELLDLTDLDGDIDIDVGDGRAQLAILNDEGGEGLNVLVGRDGQVLTALQELTRLTVQAQTGQRSWLMLDIDGYRDRRKDDLRQVAQDAVDSVRNEGGPVSLRPMNSFERKVVHDVVAKAGLRSESEGEGDSRHVVVHAG